MLTRQNAPASEAFPFLVAGALLSAVTTREKAVEV
jgi:hypothetical protein